MTDSARSRATAGAKPAIHEHRLVVGHRHATGSLLRVPFWRLRRLTNWGRATVLQKPDTGLDWALTVAHAVWYFAGVSLGVRPKKRALTRSLCDLTPVREMGQSERVSSGVWRVTESVSPRSLILAAVSPVRKWNSAATQPRPTDNAAPAIGTFRTSSVTGADLRRTGARCRCGCANGLYLERRDGAFIGSDLAPHLSQWSSWPE